MTKVEVCASPKNSGHRLDLYHQGVHIGQYEWSSDKHKDAKVKEAEGATELLLDAYRRHGGKIAVRWNPKEGLARHMRKEIRTYQEGQKNPGRGGTVLGVIPPEFWTSRKP